MAEASAAMTGKSFSTFTTAQGLANNNVRSITEDKTGNLWSALMAEVSAAMTANHSARLPPLRGLYIIMFGASPRINGEISGWH